MSPGLQVWSYQGSSGPYIRRIVNQPFPGTVWIQLFWSSAGCSGPEQDVD